MKEALLYLWQLPQNLLGLLVIFFSRARKFADGTWRTKRVFGISLGRYIILWEGGSDTDVLHERGHQRQSLCLGPLYLIVIGLPSLMGNIVCRIRPFDYYSQPWEAWADRLGGVVR